MYNNWTFIALSSAFFITLIPLWVGRVGNVRFNKAIGLSAAGALIAFQLLFFLRQSFTFPNQEAPFQHLLLLTAGLILFCNAGVELAKWALVEFIAKPRRVRIPRFLLDLAGWVLLSTVAVAVIRRIFSLELTGILVSSTVVSAVIALSLQQLFSGLFAGLLLEIEAPFRVDDWVEVNGQEGRVIKQNWRTLAIITHKNEYIIIPNGSAAQSKIINYSRPGPVVADDLLIGVGYLYPPGEVKSLLCNAVADIEGIVTTPTPQVVIHEYANNSINYRVRYWFSDYGQKQFLRDQVFTRVWYTLRRAEMTLSNVNLNQNDETRQQQILNTLRANVLFTDLSATQIEEVAARAQLRRYTTGERLVQEGAAGDSLFLIKDGCVHVLVNGVQNRQVQVASLAAGDFFGEMSLLTGEPRAASVVATTETETVIINKQAFTEVLTADPTILTLLVDALGKRRTILQSRLAEDSARVEPINARERMAMLQRIVSFLGLRSGSI